MKWLHIPLWVLLVGLSTAGLLVLSLAIPSLTGKEEQSGQATAVVTEQKGVLPGLDLRTTVKDTDTYTSAISELSSDSETVNAPIREWIDGQTRTFKEELKENGSKQGEEMRAHLNIGLDTKQAGDSLFSLVFTSYRFTGGANGQTEVMPFTVDMNEKRIVPLGELFDLEGGLDAAELGRLVKEAIEAQDGLMDQVSDEALEAALADPSSWKWSLGDGSFTVYFDEYEVAAGSAGIVQAELPYDQVSLLMNPEASARIGVAKPSGTIDGDVRGTGEPEPLDPDGKYVALTFDDGPHPQVTPRVLETLEREDVKATFFMLGSQAEFYPDVARQVAEAGHEIGNHSDSHPDLTKFGIDGIRRQMVGSARKIEAATGVRPDVERPPYGAINDAVKQAASESGTPIVLWSVDSLDWKSRNAGAVNRLVSGRVHPGAIILMHDIHASTADALPQMIAELKAKGYQFVTVRQLAGLTADSGIGPYFNQ